MPPFFLKKAAVLTGNEKFHFKSDSYMVSAFPWLFLPLEVALNHINCYHAVLCILKGDDDSVEMCMNF